MSELITAGMLDRVVTIRENQPTQDPSYGTSVDNWVNVASRIPANVQDVLPSRSEFVRQGVQIAANQTRIRLRYRAGLHSKMQIIVHGVVDVTYNIISGPAEIGKREGIEFMCERYSL